MLLARAVVVDPMAHFAIGFLGLILVITIGLGIWITMHIMKKNSKAQ